jgi:hypothetical protein
MKHLVVLLMMLCIRLGFSQDVVNDSVIPYKKAAILSAFLPGAGQIYNSIHTSGRKNAYWKVPLIAAGIGGTTFLLIQNQRLVQSIKTEYDQRIVAGPSNPLWFDYDNLALVSLYDQYARQRDLAILGIGAVYAFQILDAAVEAHFLHFDVSKDLSLTIHPSMVSRNVLGMRASFSLR